MLQAFCKIIKYVGLKEKTDFLRAYKWSFSRLTSWYVHSFTIFSFIKGGKEDKNKEKLSVQIQNYR